MKNEFLIIFTLLASHNHVFTALSPNQQLFRAIEEHNVDDIKKALEAGANVNEKRFFDRSALHYAVSNPRKNSPEILLLLIDNGADIEAIDEAGFTPLLLAVANFAGSDEQINNINLLIELGANINAKTYRNKTIQDLLMDDRLPRSFLPPATARQKRKDLLFKIQNPKQTGSVKLPSAAKIPEKQLERQSWYEYFASYLRKKA